MIEAILGALIGLAGSFLLQLINDKRKLLDLIYSIQIQQAKINSRLEEAIRDIDELKKLLTIKA
jgi:hypothetical protein